MDVVAIFGPTGVGKTGVAEALARLLRERGGDPIAVSADALQIYRGLETLTGAADGSGDLETVLRSNLSVTERFSAGAFAEQAHAAIDSALASGRRPIVVGGTGLYLRAALTELRLKPPPPPGLRERIDADMAARGAAALHADLAARAPERAAAIAPTDRSRIVRALELHEMGALGDYGDQLWTDEMRVPTRLFGLVMDRESLYARIDARVDAMVAAGAADEVRAADAAGASRTARAALGFSELLEGDVDAMKRRTRQYAKRQLTWMRKLAGVELLDVTDGDAGAAAERIAATL
ncbi:MAG: tRNA dimethylallyltransferase [Thermoleophilales bacterium]|nr:tRNA dimethylallyltransferase [Thermoleophilales bacterium]